MKITICISTLKRIEYLRALLLSINAQQLDTPSIIKVVVVENSADRDSEALINELQNQVKYPIAYASESRVGIPFSRNKAVHLADSDTDFVVFVDDDEFADPKWIQNLLDAQKEFGADLVSGAVRQRFIGTPPGWIIKGAFFTKRFYKKIKTGDTRKYSSTNNLMVRYNALMKLQGPFNEAMVFTGGSDIEMTQRLCNGGCKIVWTHEAVVFEWIPAERATLKWVLQRALRVSSSNWFLEQNKTAFNAIKTFMSGVMRIIFGVIFITPALILAPFTGLQYVVHVIRIIVRGVGIIGGLFGLRHEEYRKFYTHTNNT